MKTEVWDSDRGVRFGHDMIDDELQLVWNGRPARNKYSSVYQTYVLKGSTGKRLVIYNSSCYRPTCLTTTIEYSCPSVCVWVSVCVCVCERVCVCACMCVSYVNKIFQYHFA